VEFERGILRAEQLDHFVVDDFDDLLPGLDALNDLLAEGLFLDALDEVAGDLEIHVGVQQGHSHLAQRVGDVGIRDFSQAAQVSENVLELAAERIEHGIKVGSKVERSKWNFVGGQSSVASGRIPKWPTGADCKSAGLRLRWFESSSYHHFQFPCIYRAVVHLSGYSVARSTPFPPIPISKNVDRCHSNGTHVGPKGSGKGC